MSLFTSGDNGTFDSTVDPNGNPPSDWNITKAADSIVKFNNVNPITGTGSMHCESRTIFNDEYLAHFFRPQSQFSNQEKFLIEGLDFNQDFTVEFYFKDIGSTGESDDNVTILFFGSGTQGISIRRNSGGSLFYRLSGGTTISTGQSTVNGQINKLVFTHEVGGDTKIHFNSYTKIETGDVFSFDTEGCYFVFNESSSTSYNTGNLYISDLKVYLGVAATQLQVDEMSRKNVIASLSSFLAARLQMNQEQSRIINNSKGGNIEVDENYSDGEVSFEGGFWVDESTI